MRCVLLTTLAMFVISWQSGCAAAAGDKFRFSADPFTDIVEVPVLFYSDPRYGGRASAYTCDCVNALVNGNVIITPKPFGPSVNGEDILQTYTRKAFALCGYQQDDNHIRFVDARYYHRKDGSVHCATNVIRDLPSEVWWQ